jgi:hypothetical protein
METILGSIIGILFLCILALAFFEYRIRQPGVIVLYDSTGRIGVRKGLVYPRHFSLPLKRTTCPLQLTIEATAVGNLGVRVKIVGSVEPSLEHIQSLVRAGGWNDEAVARAVEEVGIMLMGLVKDYTERSEIHALSSSGLLDYLNEHAGLIEEKFGVEMISLAVESLEPTSMEIADALRQQEQARLLEQTESLNHRARVAAAKAKYQSDAEIAEMEHSLEMKKVVLKKTLLERDSELAYSRIEDELKRNRLRLAFEKEELEVLGNNPELLMLTPQAARLAEASQSLKNARTVIYLNPQDFAHNSELLNLFHNFLQKVSEAKKEG